jgi:hypothetical protein
VDLHHLLLAGLPAHFESSHPSHAVWSLWAMSGCGIMRNSGPSRRRPVSRARTRFLGLTAAAQTPAPHRRAPVGRNRRHGGAASGDRCARLRQRSGGLQYAQSVERLAPSLSLLASFLRQVASPNGSSRAARRAANCSRGNRVVGGISLGHLLWHEACVSHSTISRDQCRQPALQKFYGSLTDEQKKRFNRLDKKLARGLARFRMR